MSTTVLGYSRHPGSAWWPQLTDEEFAALRDNIRDQGQKHPIVATKRKVVLDGWHRLRACKELKLRPVVETVDIASPNEIAATIFGLNAGRRHLRKQDRAEMFIETHLACGMKFAEEGDRQDEGDDEPAGVITRRMIMAGAGVSLPTARRAIAKAKDVHGLVRRSRKADPPPAEPEPEKPADPPAGKKDDDLLEIPPMLRRTPAAGDDEKDPFAPDEQPLPQPETRPEAAAEVQREPAEEAQPPKAKAGGRKRKAEPEPERDPADEMAAEIEKLRAELDDRNERLAIIETSASPDGQAAIAEINNLHALARTLKSQVNSWQTKHANAQRTIKTLRTKVTKLEKRVKELEGDTA